MADGMRAATPAIKKSLIARFAVTSFVLCCAEAWAWQTNVSGTAGGGQFNATVVDAAGNVVAAGVTNNTGTGDNFTVAKFDGASGAELWRQFFGFGSLTCGTKPAPKKGC